MFSCRMFRFCEAAIVEECVANDNKLETTISNTNKDPLQAADYDLCDYYH